MDVGIHIGTRGCLTTRENILAMASSAEAWAYAIIGVADHLVVQVHTYVPHAYIDDIVWPGASTGIGYVATSAMCGHAAGVGCHNCADGKMLMFHRSSADDMLEDAAAFADDGVRHLIVYAQQPTIGATLDVRQRFAEDVVRKLS